MIILLMYIYIPLEELDIQNFYIMDFPIGNIVDAYKRGARYVVFLGSEEERAKIPYSDYVAYQYERIYIFDLKPYKKIQ